MPINNYSIEPPGNSFLMDWIRGNQQAGMQQQMPFGNVPGALGTMGDGSTGDGIFNQGTPLGGGLPIGGGMQQQMPFGGAVPPLPPSSPSPEEKAALWKAMGDKIGSQNYAPLPIQKFPAYPGGTPLGGGLPIGGGMQQQMPFGNVPGGFSGRPTTYMPLGGGAAPRSSGPTTYQTGTPRLPMGGIPLPTKGLGGSFNYGQPSPARQPYRPTGVPQMGYGLRNPQFNFEPEK